MKPNFKLLGSTATLALLILSFQNCSPVKFGTNEAQAAKSGIVVPDDDLADISDDDVSDDDVDDAMDDLDDDDSDDVADNDHDDDADDDDAHDDHDKEDCPNKGPGKKDPVKKFRAICSAKKKGFAHAIADASFVGINGSLRITAPSLKEVSGNNGSVVVKHDGTGAGTIDRLGGNNGGTVICGFEVEDISGLNGRVVVVGGHVERISAVNGSVVLIDSTIGSASGINGSVRVRELK